MERRHIEVRGLVQGVGFRPFVYALATQFSLHGFVLNQTDGVHIQVQGPHEVLEQFLTCLCRDLPPLARVDAISWRPIELREEPTFEIRASQSNASETVTITPDAGTCAACVKELFDPNDRRCGYAFLNCTHCGPRLTIVTAAPYDRERTTMAPFVMCARCRAEYTNPVDRRFHAQPIACPVCGPRLAAFDPAGRRLETDHPLALAAAALRAGQVVAIKGIGGYHLACDARRQQVVAQLRRRKGHDQKALAVMVPDLEAAAELCEISLKERHLLAGWRRPIVLLRKRPACALAPSVAPGNPLLGLMLPYTPLHHLLLRALHGMPLVMTSGNRSDEPIAYQEPEAFERLGSRQHDKAGGPGIADLFLTHNRPIHVRCDDSVTRVVEGSESPIRRSRGYAPQPLALPRACPQPILAVGGQLKATFALGQKRHAIVSHHLGDLDHLQAYAAFERDIALYERLFQCTPACIVHDLHPDYASTNYARQRSARDNVRTLAVQHHHAHLASCMAEHGRDERVLGVIFDGTGYGLDGAVWGGEFLLGDYRGFERAAHLRYVGMPGGDQAIRHPWRMAVSHLVDAGCDRAHWAPCFANLPLDLVQRMLARRFNTPPTSSMGRLFDAASAIIGVCRDSAYEGQAAIELEWAAMHSDASGAYPFEILRPGQALADAPLQVDCRPLIRALWRDSRQETAAVAARRFHTTIVEIVCAVCARLRQTVGVQTVALSGGVFMNATLVTALEPRLEMAGFCVLRHHLVPPNDGGLSLGQLAIAAAQL